MNVNLMITLPPKPQGDMHAVVQWARDCDTLREIADRYGMQVASMQNSLDRELNKLPPVYTVALSSDSGAGVAGPFVTLEEAKAFEGDKGMSIYEHADGKTTELFGWSTCDDDWVAV